MQTIDDQLLATVTGAGGMGPLSGDVKQSINTNWGGTQTNIQNQIIHQAPKPPTTVVEYMHQHPELRMQKARPIRRGWF